MAKAKKTVAPKAPDSEQEQVQERQAEKGYAGSQDYQTGKVTSSDPAQATPERLKEDRERQRGSY